MVCSREDGEVFGPDVIKEPAEGASDFRVIHLLNVEGFCFFIGSGPSLLRYIETISPFVRFILFK